MKTQSYLDNVVLGDKICSSAKALFVCSNDIIPAVELPFLFRDALPAVRNKFGERRVELYLQHQQALTSARDCVNSTPSKTKLGEPARHIATTQFGVGECQESAAYVLLELLKEGRMDFMSITIRGKPPEGDPNRMYSHKFILLGSQFPNTTDIRSLNHLPDDVVVIDAYLNHVGPANTYLRDQAPYHSAYNYTHITEAGICPQSNDLVHIIQSQVEFIVASHKDKLDYFDPKQLLLSHRDELCKHHEITKLNQYVTQLNPHLPLLFFGIKNKSHPSMDAVVQIKSLEDAASCIALHRNLQTGYFSRGGAHTIFTIPQINTQPPEKIAQHLMNPT